MEYKISISMGLPQGSRVRLMTFLTYDPYVSRKSSVFPSEMNITGTLPPLLLMAKS